MAGNLRIIIGQLNFLVGDVFGNAEKIITAADKARDTHNAHVIVFPELTLTGYPPEDLLLRDGLYKRVGEAVDMLCERVRGIVVIVGYPHRDRSKQFNVASVIRDGKILATYHKRILPNYGVFDEKRYFSSGSEPCVVSIAGVAVGITICEDAWVSEPVSLSAEAGAQVVINLNASPYHLNKRQERIDIVAARAKESQVPIVYVNLVGGQDELVFDGESFVVGKDGAVTQMGGAFTEDLIPVVIEVVPYVHPLDGPKAKPLSEEESVYRALMLGVRDYLEKNGFPGGIVGLSGGIDSALTLTIAVDAFGSDKMQALMMPSRYTSQESLEDARALAEALEVKYSSISIEPMFTAYLDALKQEFLGTRPDTTEENLQARIRGMLLMAISNKTGKLVLTTGNKSELAVGYATLYGDMAGGFAVIKDVPKTLVYRLAEYRNRRSSVIPQRIFDKPPSAELASSQKDSDTLPPYSILDAILERYVEKDEGPETVIAAGFDIETVHRVVEMVNRNEYKRRQAPPGVRITPRAFGRDRRYPITSGYGRRKL